MYDSTISECSAAVRATHGPRTRARYSPPMRAALGWPRLPRRGGTATHCSSPVARTSAAAPRISHSRPDARLHTSTLGPLAAPAFMPLLPAPQSGGGVFIDSGAQVTMRNSTISVCSAGNVRATHGPRSPARPSPPICAPFCWPRLRRGGRTATHCSSPVAFASAAAPRISHSRPDARLHTSSLGHPRTEPAQTPLPPAPQSGGGVWASGEVTM